MLAGIPQNPTLYNPFLHPRTMFNRTEAVLNQMQVQGYITPVQEKAALVEMQNKHFLRHGTVRKRSMRAWTRTP